MNKPTYIQEALERIRCKYPRGLKRGHPCDIQILENTITSELQGLGERIIEELAEKAKLCNYGLEEVGYKESINTVRSLTSPDEHVKS